MIESRCTHKVTISRRCSACTQSSLVVCEFGIVEKFSPRLANGPFRFGNTFEVVLQPHPFVCLSRYDQQKCGKSGQDAETHIALACMYADERKGM